MKIPTQKIQICVGIFLQHYTFLQKRTFSILYENFSRFVRKATAITEETFYRKNMISFQNKRMLISTTLLSMFLYAIEHSLTIWGIFLTMIWALPLSISYIKTKNIYVPMTAHFIGNLLGNGIDVIMTIISMI